MDSYIPQEVVAKLATEGQLAYTSPILGAVIWIDPHGYITHANRPALQLLGCTTDEEAIGSFFTRFFKGLHLGTELGAHTFDSDTVIQGLIVEGSAISVFGCAHGADRVVRSFEGFLVTTHDGHGDAAGGVLAIQSADR